MITARKNNYFIPLSIWILLTRSYDIICTFQFTPDFSKEKNPLSSIVGLGGIGVTIAVSGHCKYQKLTRRINKKNARN